MPLAHCSTERWMKSINLRMTEMKMTDAEILKQPLKYITVDDVDALKEMFNAQGMAWLDSEMERLFDANCWLDSKYCPGVEYYPKDGITIFEIIVFLQSVTDRIMAYKTKIFTHDNNRVIELEDVFKKWEAACYYYQKWRRIICQPTESSAPLDDEADTSTAATDGDSTTDTETVKLEEVSETDTPAEPPKPQQPDESPNIPNTGTPDNGSTPEAVEFKAKLQSLRNFKTRERIITDKQIERLLEELPSIEPRNLKRRWYNVYFIIDKDNKAMSMKEFWDLVQVVVNRSGRGWTYGNFRKA